MRVVVAPDSFGQTLSATEAAAAIAAGWRRGAPEDTVAELGLSDGGPGFVEMLAHALDGSRLVRTATHDPFGRPVAGRLLVHGDTAYVESADACGLHLLAPAERDPLTASTVGVGDLLQAAVRTGADRVVVGLGGSATVDGGSGLLGRLGTTFWPGNRAGEGGELLDPSGGPAALVTLERVEPAASLDLPARLVGAVDVDVPLPGPAGAAMFARQKGASDTDLEFLERWLDRLTRVVGRDLTGTAGLEGCPGAGAAGGLGYALLVLGGALESGIDLVLGALRMDERLARADLVVTGEGSLDAQSLHGKVVAGVTRAAARAGLPCVAMAGQVAIPAADLARSGLVAAHSLALEAGSVEAALAAPAETLERLAARVAAGWGGRGG